MQEYGSAPGRIMRRRYATRKKIDAIKAKVDFDNPRQVYRLYAELQSGSYRFETQVGNNFDDEIYEKVEDLKRQGIPPDQ